MNILHLRSSGGLFGAEGVILNLSRELRGMNIKNYILCIKNLKNPHTELVDEANKLGIIARSVICRKRLDLLTIKEIRKILRDFNIDILHCHDYKANIFGFFASRFLNIRLVATNHLWTKETIVLRIYEFLDGLVLNFFKKIVTVSKSVRDESQKFLFNKSKVIVIHNGVDLNKYIPCTNGEAIRKEFDINPESKIVGSIGRLCVQKGFGYFLEAAKIVLTEIPNVHFLIVGDGPLRKDLESKVKKMRLENRIVFTGIRNDISDIYYCMDIFVLASIREGLPLVVLEALAMGRPVIATNVGGVPEAIKHDKTGILLPPKNVKNLAQAMIDLLRDKSKADFLAKNGRRLIEEEFSSAAMAKEYRKIYEEVLN